MNAEKKELLNGFFAAGIAAAMAESCLPAHLPPPPSRGRIVVIGAGKAAAAMARVAELHYQDVALSGVVVTVDGYGFPDAGGCKRIEVMEAGHPLPVAAGEEAARRIFAAVENLTPDDLVLCLISGGGSATLVSPGVGITMAEKTEVTRALLRAGVRISEINCLRKHISGIKGGRLALACRPARLRTLVISDVPGDDPADVASGPTVADRTTSNDALKVLAKYDIRPPAAIAGFLKRRESETPDPGDPRLDRAETTVVARSAEALEAVARKAAKQGYGAVILGDAVEGEAREVAASHAAMALDYVNRQGRWALISGGELTVRLDGDSGRGGPNLEYVLALAAALRGNANIWAVAGDTDGRDGSGNCAGAILYPDTLDRAAQSGLDPEAALRAHDSFRFFESLGDLVVTGPTRTNVNDLRIILIEGEAL